MAPENLLYIPQSEYDRLRRSPLVSVVGWWLSGFASGIIMAVVLGWTTPQ
jgi:hypothetical protein